MADESYDFREILSMLAGIAAILASVLTYLLKNNTIQMTAVYLSDEQLLYGSMLLLFICGIILIVDTIHPKQKSRW